MFRIHYGSTIGAFLAGMFEFVNWMPPECKEDINALATEVLAASRILHWDGKESLNSQFNRMARLGLGNYGRWYLRVT